VDNLAYFSILMLMTWWYDDMLLVPFWRNTEHTVDGHKSNCCTYFDEYACTANTVNYILTWVIKFYFC